MNTLYDAWAKFDVEQELERVDLRAQREEQERQARKQAQAKRSVEDSITQSSEDAAEILAAQAAVAALKSKRKGRRRSKNAKETENALAVTSANGESAAEKTSRAPKTRDYDSETAERLKQQAELLKRKHELLQRIMTARRDGEAMLETSKDDSKCRDALERFEEALEATRALEAMLPELSQVQEREEHDAGAKSAETDEKSHVHEHDTSHHGHDHRHHDDKCGHGCTHSHLDSEPTKQQAALPQPSNLKAVVDMFYKDIYLGIGTCQTRAKRHALASEAFKEVLVRDGSHLQAWMLRGEAFETMDAPLLAMLHYNRMTTLAPNDEEVKKAHEEIKRKVFNEENGAKEFAEADQELQQRSESGSSGEILAGIAETFQQGNVIMVEGFYDYAVRKFRAVLRMLEVAKQRQAANPELLRQLEIAASMNIASASLEMQRDYGVAFSHCERVLELDPDNAVCLYRMGQLLRVSHKYEKALSHLQRAQQLCNQTQNSTQFADAIAKEIDKTQFDRGQYDYAFIKSAASREKQCAS